MLFSFFMPAIRGGDMDARGDYDMPSPLPSHEETNMPTTESEDAMMTDQAPTEVNVQGRHSNDTAEIQQISEADFNIPQGIPQNIPHENHLIRRLRSENKRQEKKVKTQRTAIKGLKEDVENLEENLADADIHLQSYESELEDALKKLAAAEQALQGTKAELAQQRATCRLSAKDLAASRRETGDLEDIVRNLKVSNGDLHDKLVASQKQLSQCKDDLFSLLPAIQTPDSTISGEFESVGQQIVHWIDAEAVAFEKAHPEERADHIFSPGQDRDASQFLRQNPGAGEHLARHLIHRFLRDDLFERKMCILGLKDETTHMLCQAESTMAKLDPPRDSETISLWRSETLKALYATTECTEHSKRQLQNLNYHLIRELSRSLPILFSGRERISRFYGQVMRPAAKLAAEIQTSASNYNFSIPESPLTNFKPVMADYLNSVKMVDIKSGRHLKPDSAVLGDKDGILGKIIICLEPGLYRAIKGKETTLRQALYLVELNHPLGKRSKPSA